MTLPNRCWFCEVTKSCLNDAIQAIMIPIETTSARRNYMVGDNTPVPISTKLHKYSQPISTLLLRELLTTTRIMATTIIRMVAENTLKRINFLRSEMRVFHRMRIGIERT